MDKNCKTKLRMMKKLLYILIEVAPQCTTIIRCHFCACATLLCRFCPSLLKYRKEYNKKVAAKRLTKRKKRISELQVLEIK